MDRNELRWNLFRSEVEHSRQHQVQRSSTANIILAISGALLALAGFDKNISLNDLPFGLITIALGIFGCLFSIKQQERHTYHREKARCILREIEDDFPEVNYDRYDEFADSYVKKRFPWSAKRSLKEFWLTLYLLIAAVGMLISVLSLVNTAT